MEYEQRKKDSARRSYLKNKVRLQLEAKQQRSEMRTFVQSLKVSPCTDCNNTYPFYVMEFDHRDGVVKSGNISKIYQQGSWQRLYAELAKCDLVCSNCHRERTHQRMCRESAVHDNDGYKSLKTLAGELGFEPRLTESESVNDQSHTTS